MKNPFTREHYVAAAQALAEDRRFDEPVTGSIQLAETVTLFDELFSKHKPAFNKVKFHQCIHDSLAARRRRDMEPKPPEGS